MNDKVHFDKLHNTYNLDFHVTIDNLKESLCTPPWYFSVYKGVEPRTALSIALEWKVRIY